MEFILFVLMTTVAIALAGKWYFKNDMEWGEVALISLSGVIIAAVVLGISYYSSVQDVEIRNGEVTNKQRNKVSCEHSYSCNCKEVCSGTGSTRSCSTHCDTCYEHSYDVDWDVYTTIGNFAIDRINRQGTKEPPRWTKVQVGDPVARSFNYSNYIKAVDQSILNLKNNLNEKYASKVPEYPSKVYDYHFVDRVIPIGLNVPDLPKWNYDLALMLRKLGQAKQVNVIMLITNIDDPMFEYNVRSAWLGGKKNDVVVILGAPSFPEISWVGVISWTDKEFFKVKLKDDLLELKNVDREKVLNIISQNINQHFVRKQMADFAYLKEEINPSTTALIIGFILAIIIPLGWIGYKIYLKLDSAKRNARFNRYYR